MFLSISIVALSSDQGARRRQDSVRHSRADADTGLHPMREAGRYSVARLLEKHGDARLTDLLQTLADCPKARSASIL